MSFRPRLLLLCGLLCGLPSALCLPCLAEGPAVIAHRGASGYLPEHTLEAKALAHGMGAHYLEQDLVLSKDGVPMVLHDLELDTVSDVAERFPGRHREDGRFYAIDFTAEEIASLAVSERFDHRSGEPRYPGRYPVGPSPYRIRSFEEVLEFVAGLSQSTGRPVGIYPEIKNPAWHREQGQDISPIVVEILHRYGYRSKEDPCYLQCFEFEEVRRLREDLGWEGRLIQLIGGGAKGKDGTDYVHLRSPEGLAEIAPLVDGIGPSISTLITGSSPADRSLTPLAETARRLGLAVHPYTARADDLPRTVESLDELHRILFHELKVDGLFTDFPDLALEFLKASR